MRGRRVELAGRELPSMQTLFPSRLLLAFAKAGFLNVPVGSLLSVARYCQVSGEVVEIYIQLINS